MSLDRPRNAVLDALRRHNPWWDGGRDAFELPARPRSDYYHLVRPGESDAQFTERRLFALVGRRGVGKTTLLWQFIDQRLAEGVAPERFCYLPFDANPLYQLRSDDQLRQAVRYYESRIVGRLDEAGPQFLVLDDVNRIEHPNKPAVDGWGTVVTELLDADPARHVLVTASSEIQVRRELDRVGLSSDAYGLQPILPEKFRDYVFSLHRDLERDEEKRLSPTSLRTGESSLPAALDAGDPAPFVAELRAKRARVADDVARIQSQVGDYLAMGGLLSYAHEGPVESAASLDARAYAALRDDVRHALYQDVPDFESIRTIADLERLCALAATERAGDPVRYQELASLFDVDRRTLTDSYLPALAELYLLTPATEYDNSRPRSVKLYLRDVGLVTALAAHDHTRVLDDFALESEHARLVGFDHTMRLAYGMNAVQGTADGPPTLWYWDRAGDGVEYVFELDDTPVPVGLAYRPGSLDGTVRAVAAFLDAFDAPLGLVVTGDTVHSAEAVSTPAERVVQLPYWLYLMLC